MPGTMMEQRMGNSVYTNLVIEHLRAATLQMAFS